MILDPIINFISRLVRGSGAFNTLNTRTVEVFFQRSPNLPSGDTRGIKGLDFQVVTGGSVTQNGQTGADGKITVGVRGGEATLQLLHAGAPVAEYRVTIRAAALEAAATLTGQQRRLRFLGYQLGPAGPDQNGVDGVLGPRTDRGILNFQADSGIKFEGVVDPPTRNQLTTQVGA